MNVYNTLFQANTASEGGAVYILSPAPHRFERCQWLDNYGIASDAYQRIFPQGVTSRGAALYAGLLSLDVRLTSCEFVNNTADESGTFSIRPTVSQGKVVFDKCTIDDTAPMLLGRTTFKWKYIPGIKIWLLFSQVKGTGFFSTGVVVHMSHTIFSEANSVTIDGGGLLILEEGCQPSGVKMKYLAECDSGRGDIQTVSGDGSIGICHMKGNQDTEIVLASSNHLPISPDAYKVHMGEMYVTEVDETESFTVSTDHADLTKEGTRFGWVHVPEAPAACDNTNTALTCTDDRNTNSLQLWAVIIIIGMTSLIVLIGVVRLFALYRRWAVPGQGLVGCVAPCVCYRFLSCEWLYGSQEKDAFTDDRTLSLEMEMQMIKIIRGEGLQETKSNDADGHLRAIEMHAMNPGEATIEQRVAYVSVGLREGCKRA